MTLLLTSGGVTNTSIRETLVGLLGKPITECSALCIPTAQYGHPWVGPGEKAWQYISGASTNPMVDLGWASMGVLELTALPSIDRDRWVPLVQESDALLVARGRVLYLAYWLRNSGLADLLPSLRDTVREGLSAGSMVLTSEVGEDVIQWRPPNGEPGNSMAEAEQWAAGISGPAYASDDQSAIALVDGAVEVVSEGLWRLL